MSDQVLDQSRVDNQGNFRLSLAGYDFTMPLLHETLTGEEPVVRFAAGTQSVTELAEFTKAVNADVDRSDIKKVKDLDPEREKVLKWVAGHVVEIDAYEKRIDAREAKLFEVPRVHEQASAVAVEDWEIRQWWGARSASERADFMRRIASEAGHERLQLALLRAPYALADLEITSVRSAWNRGKRLDNPAEATAIDQGRVVTEWARRGFKHVAGIAMNVAGFPRDRVLQCLLSDETVAPAASAFGFPADLVAHMRRRLDGLARRRSA